MFTTLESTTVSEPFEFTDDKISVEAPGFYQKLGYDIAVIIDRDPPGLTHYYMMKRLTPSHP